MLYFLFVQYIEISYRNSIDSWEFFIDNIKYTILYSNINKKGNYYTIEYSPEPGISIGERKGIAIIRNDTIYFTETDSTMYFIYNSYLYNYKETDKIKIIDSNTFLFDGGVSLNDVQKILDIKIEEDEVDTLAGYLVKLLDRIPKEGEKPIVETEKVTYKVEKVAGLYDTENKKHQAGSIYNSNRNISNINYNG